MAAWIAKIGQLLSNPEALEKICNVLPELADDFKEIALSYPDLVKESEKLSQKNMEIYNEMCKTVLQELQRVSVSEDISSEDRKYIIDKMFELLKLHGTKTAENRLMTNDNLRMVGEFLLLGPFGAIPEVIVRKRKRMELEAADRNDQ